MAISRSSMDAFGSMLLMGIAAAIVHLSGLAFAPLVIAFLLVLVMLATGHLFMGGFDIAYLATWFFVAFFLSIYNLVKGLEQMNMPTLPGTGWLAGSSIAIVLIFPPFWSMVLGG